MPRKVHHREVQSYLQETASIPAMVAVVEGTADGQAKLPAGADAGAFIGITKYLGSTTAGDPIEIVTDGCVDVLVKAAGTAIVRGDYLSIHGTSGYLKKSALTNTGNVVAQALESVNADDVVIAARIVRCPLPSA